MSEEKVWECNSCQYGCRMVQVERPTKCMSPPDPPIWSDTGEKFTGILNKPDVEEVVEGDEFKIKKTYY